MSENLKILHLEDDPLDAELVKERLEEGGLHFETTCIQSRDDFVHLLNTRRFDLILADRTTPTFDGISALAVAREFAPETPFIFVSGTLEEETAIETLKQGATDYVLKHRISRLLPAVNRALEEFRQRRERKILEQQFIQAQKMESLGMLTGGIAHDFNNLLTIIQGYLSLLDEQHSPAQTAEILDIVKSAADRGASLVRQLLTFSRKSEFRLEKIILNDLIVELVKMLTRTFPQTVRVVTELDASLPPIMGDAGQIHQALLNLCVNARDAMQNGGMLTIRTSSIVTSAPHTNHISATHGPCVCISISDTGNGMDAATKQRIFDPFFTTKEPGKGTGLGLAVLYGVVQNHHGYVTVESEPGQGTEFQIFLPVLASKEHSLDFAADPAENIAGGGETILIVEDEQVLQHLLKTLLEARGYHVLLARDGVDGVEVFARNRRLIDLIISDIGLPRVGGLQMFHEIKKMNSQIKSIFYTGYLDEALREELHSAGVREIVQKPYRAVEILKKVREVLDHEPAGEQSAGCLAHF